LAWINEIAACADGVVCVSRTVAEDWLSFLDETQADRIRTAPLKIGYFHHGANSFSAGKRLTGAAEGKRHRLKELERRQFLLIVSRIDRHKRVEQAVEELEMLWKQGEQTSLVIVGREEGVQTQLREAIENSPFYGERLFWLKDVDDEELSVLYKQAKCVLAPSMAEGFGLPLIEAAIHGRPLLCRDLPVFREVAGEHATYFKDEGPGSMAGAVKKWLEADRRGLAVQSAGMKWLTWSESAEMLRRVILEDQWLTEWRPRREATKVGRG
jgi:glycosyltransferase involved in cell wall biosynthesis